MWVPTEKPYRVIISSAWRGVGNWNEKTEVFATLEEAKMRAARVKNPRLDVRIDVAINPETWRENGRWKNLHKGKGGSSIL